MYDLELGTLVTYNPVAVRAEDRLEDLVEQFEWADFHHWPVVDDERRLVGVLSIDDILRVAFAHQLAAAAVAGGVLGPELRPALRARDAMSPRVITIDRYASAGDALDILIERQISSLPVVDGERLVGIVTSTDFVREFSYGELPQSRLNVSRYMAAVRPEEMLDATASLDEAKHELTALAAKHAVVASGGCPLGVVSLRDIRKSKWRQVAAELLRGESQPVETTLGELVSSAVALRPGDLLVTAAQKMHEHRRRALAVVNQGNRLLGVVTEEELLRAMRSRSLE